jgi:hypothetical protein
MVVPANGWERMSLLFQEAEVDLESAEQTANDKQNLYTL